MFVCLLVCMCVCARATCATYIKGFSKRLPREPTISPSVQNAWPRKSCEKTRKKTRGAENRHTFAGGKPEERVAQWIVCQDVFAISFFWRWLLQMQHFTPRWSSFCKMLLVYFRNISKFCELNDLWMSWGFSSWTYTGNNHFHHTIFHDASCGINFRQTEQTAIIQISRDTECKLFN